MKKMLEQKYLVEWNKICPECPLSVGDLNTPTEALFTRILVAYLRLLGYKVEPTFQMNVNKDDGREKRVFLIKLLRQTEQILRLTDPTYIFAYLDLIQPTAEKFSNILKSLFDYYFFYRMFKESALSKANRCIGEMKDLQEKLTKVNEHENEMQQKMKNLKESMEIMQKNILEARAVLDETRDEVNALKQKHFEVKNRVKMEFDAMVNLEHQDKRFMEKRNLQAEIQELEQEYNNGQAKLQEILQEKKDVESALNENIQKLLMQRDLKKGLKEIVDLVPTDLLERFEQNMEKLEKEQADLEQVESEKEKKSHEVKECNTALENIKKEQIKSKENYRQVEKMLMEDIKKLREQLIQKSIEIHKLKEEAQSLHCRAEKFRDMCKFLFELDKELFYKN